MTVQRSQPMSATPDRFEITWHKGAYYVSVPNYRGGVVYTSEYVSTLKARVADLEGALVEIANISPIPITIARNALAAHQSAPVLAATHNSGEGDPAVRQYCAGADTTQSEKPK